MPGVGAHGSASHPGHVAFPRRSPDTRSAWCGSRRGHWWLRWQGLQPGCHWLKQTISQTKGVCSGAPGSTALAHVMPVDRRSTIRSLPLGWPRPPACWSPARTTPQPGAKLVMPGHICPGLWWVPAVPGVPQQPRCRRSRRVHGQVGCPGCHPAPQVHRGWHLPAAQVDVPAVDTWLWSPAMRGLGDPTGPQAPGQCNPPACSALWISCWGAGYQCR